MRLVDKHNFDPVDQITGIKYWDYQIYRTQSYAHHLKLYNDEAFQTRLKNARNFLKGNFKKLFDENFENL